MPLLGALLGTVLERFITRFAPWVMFAVLCAIGGKMLWDGLHDGGQDGQTQTRCCSVGLIAFRRWQPALTRLPLGSGLRCPGKTHLPPCRSLR
jgi:putative Mn2+ efflux pump MntP